MTPLPALLGGSGGMGWRLDDARFATTWDSGEGAYRFGGRWNTPGVRAVYAALDPSTAILEVAVHKGFATLDTVPHVLTGFSIDDPSAVFVVQPADVPNANWLTPGVPSAGQQSFGNGLLAKHLFVAIPSAVSAYSWNVIFIAARAAGHYTLHRQAPFALDTRLNPPLAR